MNTASDSSTTLEPKRHFLVIASASRGARFFVKKAIQRGHRVTALCRARDDAAALERMEEGEFGYCDDCGEEIAPGRLRLDPAAMICVDCARG